MSDNKQNKNKNKKQRRSCVRNDAYELWTANNIKDRKQLTNIILNEEKKNSISWLCWCSSLIDATFWVYTLLFCEETIRSFHRDNSKYLFAPALQTTHKIEICVVRMKETGSCVNLLSWNVDFRFVFHRENQINNEHVTAGSSSRTHKSTQFFF